MGSAMSAAADMTDSLLSIRDLSVAFRHGERELLAADRVSFDIKPGETVALVGESGSGKSVTALSILKLLPGSARHPSGSIRFKGRELMKLSEREIRHVRGNDITIVFQEPMTSLNPLHTVERQIAEVLELHAGVTGAAARTRVVELLAQVGIPDPQSRLPSYPHQLSGGQRQRVMIALALANEPDLLIADEPTTALDVTVQAQIIKLIKDLQARLGMAVLFITHDLGIVRKTAERVCVMRQGRIVEQGAVADVFADPQHPYTRELIAAEPKPDPAPLRVFAAHGRPHQGGRRGQHRGAQGRDARRRRRIRLRQDHAGPRDPAADLLAAPDRVPGSLRLALAAHVALRRHRRRPVGASPRHAESGARGAGDPGAGRGRARSGNAVPLSARVLRRPAPAHRGGAHAGARADLHRARRADQRARHADPGADRRPLARAAEAPRADLFVHLA